jgi:AcrR family transcriptional regulator
MNGHRNNGNRKEKILEAALLCFNEKGYHKTSIDTIAQIGRISKGGIYYYFRSKEELFLELFKFRLNRYIDQLKICVEKERDPQKRLLLIIQKWGSLILKENQDFFRFCLEFSAMGARDKEIRKAMTSFYKNSTVTLGQIIIEGIAVGEFKPLDPEKIARLFFSLFQGIFSTYFSVNHDFDLIEQHTFNMKALLQGIQNIKNTDTDASTAKRKEVY